MASSSTECLVASRDGDNFDNLQTSSQPEEMQSITGDIFLNGCRVMLVGKTGSGKSTLGNILLDKPDVFPSEEEEEDVVQPASTSESSVPETDSFVVGTGFDAETKNCDYKQGLAWGRYLKVVDTPGLFDPTENLKETLDKLTSSLGPISPGPHAILFVTRCDIRFTDEEKKSFDEIVRVFGETAKKHIIVVFTRGDTLGNRHIDRLLAKAPENLKQVMAVVGENYAVLSKTDDRDKRRAEVENLLAKIDHVSEDGYFSNSDMERMAEEIEAEVKEMMKKENISYEEADLRVRRGVARKEKGFMKLWIKLALIGLGSIVFGVLVGLTGGLVAGGVVAVGVIDAVMIGVSTGGATIAGSAVISTALMKLKEKIDRNKQQGRRCTIM
ncbi:GTPase IMAP family member 4-like [Littorina saxatilis]|uniref:AIG1-type G domain-containing protein n=1 Tax=Littorina saxatilis TaxID=31220 RepID=A0AAN9GPV7_9CAEN